MKYSRQELYQNIGKQGQALLGKKHVVIVGVGALGGVAAELLTRAGIGKLTLIDRDCVELHNLQRQTLYDEADVGQAKALAAAARLKAINKEVEAVAHVADLDYDNVSLLQGDVVLDGTDNLATRFLVNEYCKKNGKPWIYAAAVRDEGYVKVYFPAKDCFACTFTATTGLESCDTAGVLNTVIPAVASMQVTEAIKLLLEKKVEEQLLHFHAWQQKLEKIQIQQNKECKVCQGTYEYLVGKHRQTLLKFCGSGTYQIKGAPVPLETLQKKLSALGQVTSFASGLHFDKFTIFADGRALIKADNETEAKSLYGRYIGY